MGVIEAHEHVVRVAKPSAPPLQLLLGVSEGFGGKIEAKAFVARAPRFEYRVNQSEDLVSWLSLAAQVAHHPYSAFAVPLK